MAMQNHPAAEFARAIRAHALRMVYRSHASHIGTCLSVADLLAVLYACVLRVDPQNPQWEERDRFIMSKGHAAAITYAALAERGFFPLQWLNSYCEDGSKLGGHVTRYGMPGVELSTGSLGHGLPVGCGMALAGKRDAKSYRVFVLISDGELDEGSNWEAALFAAHHRLDNLLVIVDYNKIQSFGTVEEVLDLQPLAEKWRAFRWAVREIDGHDYAQIEDALVSAPFASGRPGVIIAHTVKGKGVSFAEDTYVWHSNTVSDEIFARALAELEAS